MKNLEKTNGTNQENNNEYHPESYKLSEEVEIDKEGNQKVTQRARQSLENATTVDLTNKDNLNRGVHNDAEVKKTIENEDLNSDITVTRYPNSNQDNHINRGNIKLDE